MLILEGFKQVGSGDIGDTGVQGVVLTEINGA